MSAEIFLTCFAACLFAFLVVAVFGVQIGLYFAKRAFMKWLPEIMHAATATPRTENAWPNDDSRIIEELRKAAAMTPPGVIPHLPMIKCRCGRDQAVPPETNLQPFLLGRGWRCDERFDGWGCPDCVAAKPS